MTTHSQQHDKCELWQGALLVLLVFVAYFPALRGQFLWDDDANVIENQPLRTLDGLRRIWLEPGATQQYYPLTHTSFWLDYHLWGLNTTGYHVVNILLHACSALLLWRILKRLGVPGAWLGGAFFGLHPVCVETVAWITERKNTLSGIFFLGAILFSLRFWLPDPAPSLQKNKAKPRAQVEAVSRHGSWKFYWLALFLYLCALWAKTAAVGLPAVLVLLLWWKRGKFERRNAILILPFLAVGMVMGLITMWVEKNHVGATGQEWNFSWVERCLIASRALWFYLGKLLFPYPLEFMYPRWVIRASQPLAYLPLVTAVAGILLLWRRHNGWARPVLFTAGYFIAMLVPVLGFFNVFFFRYSFVCDHFQYLACMAPLALAGAGIAYALASLGKGLSFLKPVVYGALLLALGILTLRQAGVYRNVEILWRDTLAHNERSWLAHSNLGNVLLDKGEIQEAIQQYNETLRIKPDTASAHNNLGNVMFSQGNTNEAIQQYKEALQVQPDYAPAHNNLGNVLLKEGKVDEAIVQINQALKIDPEFTDAHYNLGVALDAKGDLDGAVRQYNDVLRLKPDEAQAHNNLGNVLARKGKVDEAILQYTLALQLKPDYALAHVNLGHALASKGNLHDAIQQYLQALQIDPKLADAHYNLGHAYAGEGNLDDAILQYNEALRLNPDNAQVHKSLANVLARKGNMDEAAQHYQRALQIQPELADAHYNLGVVMVRQGRLAEARGQFAEALRLKPGYLEAARQLQSLPP